MPESSPDLKEGEVTLSDGEGAGNEVGTFRIGEADLKLERIEESEERIEESEERIEESEEGRPGAKVVGGDSGVEMENDSADWDLSSRRDFLVKGKFAVEVLVKVGRGVEVDLGGEEQGGDSIRERKVLANLEERARAERKGVSEEGAEDRGQNWTHPR